jgi:hypothetical protein
MRLQNLRTTAGSVRKSGSNVEISNRRWATSQSVGEAQAAFNHSSALEFPR